jgi:hypothetical protein
MFFKCGALLCLASDVTLYSCARAQRPNRSLSRSLTHSLTHTHSQKGMEVTLLRLASQAFRSSTGGRFTVNVCSTTRTPSVSTGRSQRQLRLSAWLTAVSRQAVVRWDGRHFSRLQCCGCKFLFLYLFTFLLCFGFLPFVFFVTQSNTHSVSELVTTSLGLFRGCC